MLPKSRILSALLVGLGVALMAGGLLSPALINADGRLPLDLENTTWTIKDEQAQTRLLTSPDGRVLDAPVSRQLHLDVQEPATEDNVSIRVGATTMRDSMQADADRLITAQTWSYVMNRVTGEAETDADLIHTIGFPPETVPVDGHWLKLPSDAEQTTYPVFDETLRESRPAVFVEEQEIDGRTIYQYRQVIEPTNVAELYEGFFTGTEVDGEQWPLFHSVTRDLYVDQITGLVVDVTESVDDFYAPNADAPVEERQTVLLFEGSRDDAQVSASMAELDGMLDPATVRVIQWVVIAVGGALILIGVIGAFRGRGRSR
ncbi:hypothetical protein B841_02375 [Corynebacterium maris DSM 45190]|uniref:DUF3068 domain-containing protein n=1 Tax=Corynebacterium maris DSM 45190 TaxID=1224163 RepID=S5TH13_9CORY|nr:DUF3068 domain-containing protein [Corynebacterium maris]AGS33958.1 hypothetical protein B841_02375 [Corynebacterium maris DSM 45190]